MDDSREARDNTDTFVLRYGKIFLYDTLAYL